MTKAYRVSLGWALITTFLIGTDAAWADDALPRRKPWTTSRVSGTPEPPPPYRTQRAFPNLSFTRPVTITNAPGTERMFVVEQHGKIFSFDPRRADPKPELLLDAQDLVANLNKTGPFKLALEAVYGLAVHPRFAENREVFVCYAVRYDDPRKSGRHDDGTRVSRFKLDGIDPPRIDPNSEQLLLTWLQGGHNGGCLKFGHDGMLYISSGDGGDAFPPDGNRTGQNLDDLLSCVLRIDVNRADEGRTYAIPADNPFTTTPGARGEIWSYGFRNPWKISFDRANGDLWVGDVGWELWELIFRVRKGDNFGWSIVEGRQSVNTQWERGPTPITPPTVEIPHTDGASITGGFVYRGKQFPELVGTYLFGDWETRRIWGTSAASPGDYRDLANPTVRIIDFGEDNAGEPYLLDYDDGTLFRLIRNPIEKENIAFPTKLSDTGLFISTPKQHPAEGVLPFSINAEQWSDFATGERFIAVPGDVGIKLFPRAKNVPGSMFSRSMEFPIDTVLAKTLSLEMKQGDANSRRRIETQLLHYNGRDWLGYTYAWNEEQTDALLVPREGAERTIIVNDDKSPGGRREQSWRFFARAECIRCHNPWAEYALAFTPAQLNRDHDFGVVVENQIRAYRRLGWFDDVAETFNPNKPFDKPQQPKTESQMRKFVDPHDESADVNARARTYLHVNCAHCHRFGGGGSAFLHLPAETSLREMKAIGTAPGQGTFGLTEAQVISPGKPFHSTLYARMAKTGSGHMPYLGAKIIDRRGLALIHDWIQQLPANPEDFERIARLTALDESKLLAQEKEDAPGEIFDLANQFAREANRKEANEEDKRLAEEKYRVRVEERRLARGQERTKLIGEMLADFSQALATVRLLDRDRLPASLRELIIATGVNHDQPTIRDLFEPFLPEEKRTKRLGETLDAKLVLNTNGDAERGRRLFAESQTLQCRKCHKVGAVGKDFGPELSQIGKKWDRAKLLESIVDPSKEIAPAYLQWFVETDDGRVLSGLLIQRDEREIVLRDAQYKEHRLATDQIERMQSQTKSLMPELQLRDLSAQQAADLLEYLQSLK